ncbi:MAG: hypothetical protein M1816_004463 [Peltula sp. TS41687]|nr:MAG: hypothetical protein M1816_004463 [Peltula sp. TS41687]
MAGASSISSDVIALISTLLISLLVLLLLRYFLPLRATPAFVLIPLFLALALPASVILLVPIDLASSLKGLSNGSRRVWLPDRVVLVAWRITYWLCFTLTWLILPILGEYVDSGERSAEARLWYSLRSNARYHLIVLGCCALGLVYIIIQHGFNPTSLKGLIMALAYCWGLLLAIYLMGHGLVAVPRRLIRNASLSGSLRGLYENAVKVYDGLDDAGQKLEQLETQAAELRLRKGGISVEHREWIQDLADGSSLSGSSFVAAVNRPTVPAVITDNYLANLTRSLLRARHKKARYYDSFNNLVEDAKRIQSILDSVATKRLSFEDNPNNLSSYGRLTLLTPYTRHILYYRLIPAMRYFLGILLSLASLCIIWSEIIKVISSRLSIVSLTVVHSPSPERSQVGIHGQLIASGWLLYMCAAALTSMSDAKVWGNRALVRRNTYQESACWYASQVAKLTVPLAYNFLTFFPPEVHRETAFYRFLGRLINLTPLGKGFDDFLPIFILLPVGATLFNVYGRLANFCSFGADTQDDEEDQTSSGTGNWREGRDLIERAANGTLSSDRLGLDAFGDRSTDASRGPPQPSSTSHRQAQQRLSLSYEDRPSPRRNRRDGVDQEQEREESILQDLAHRMKNTFDIAEAPRWMQGFGRNQSVSNTSWPKWLSPSSAQGQESTNDINITRGSERLGGTAAAAATDQPGVLNRLFGRGRRRDGRIIL